MRALVLLLALGIASASASGQTTVGGFVSGSAGADRGYTMTFNPPPFNLPVVTGMPYSAEQVGETVQTLADGTHITRAMPPVRMYRDSQGRTRTERQMGPMLAGTGGNAPQPVMIEIQDPAAGVMYYLDTQNKVAHRVTLPPAPPRPAPGQGTITRGMPVQGAPRPNAIVPGPGPSGPANVDPSRPQFSSEPLGTQVIEGVLTEGTKTTVTQPVGSMGNDRPIVTIREMWVSRELGLTVLSKASDPRNGDYTMKLINISRSEQAISLFLPPADYTVVDDSGPVTIKYAMPR